MIPAALIVIVLFIVLIYFYTGQVQRQVHPKLRPIPAFAALKRCLAESIERGHRVHVTVGTGTFLNHSAVDTLAGLAVVDYVADAMYAAQVPVTVTTSDPAVAIVAQDRLEQPGGGTTSQPAPTVDTHVAQWIAPTSTAYAVGVMAMLAFDRFGCNVMVGHFDDSYLLIAEPTQRRNSTVTTLAGSSNPNIMAYVYATSPQGLWGEELYAAGAYLMEKPSHIGSLLAQDTLRWVIGLIILGGVILKAFGLIGFA